MSAQTTYGTSLEETLLPNQLCVFAITVFVYDYILTFEDEVRLVWNFRSTKQKPVTFLYFMIRYLAFPSLMFGIIHGRVDYSQNNSSRSLNWKFFGIPFVILSILTVACSEIVIFLRTYAIWGYSRRLLIFLSFLAVTEIIAAGITVALVSNDVAYASIVLNESIVFCLTVYKYFWFSRHGEAELARLVLRDSLFYFVLTLTTSVMNLVNEFSPWVGYSLNGLPEIQVSFHSVLCTRMILNLRRQTSESNARDNPDPGLEIYVGTPMERLV